MNTCTRFLALIAALMMLFACAVAENTEENLNPVLAVVDGSEITLSQADEMAYMLYYYGYISNYPDYASAVDYLVDTAVIEAQVKKGGFNQFPEEEMAAFRNEAAAQWEEMINQYVTNYLTEDTAEARATLREQAVSYYTAYGYSEEMLLEELLMQEGYALLEKSLMGDYVPTEEEIQTVFEQYGAEQQAMFENDVATYEYYTNYYGYESWYVPAGYRSVLHILLSVDEALLTAWQDAQLALDEAASAETVDEAAVAAAKEALNNAAAAIEASKETELNDIYARLEKSEDIKVLINEYNTDPGMQDAATLEKGYHVNANSIIYDANFTAGSFQEQMTAPGTYSEPVVSQFGIHVIYYLADVPGGLVLTDSIREEISTYLTESYMSQAYTDALATWTAEMNIVINTEAIEQAQADAAAAMAESTVTE